MRYTIYFYEVCDSLYLYVPNPIARRLSNGTTALGGQGLANGFLRRRLRLPRFTASHDSHVRFSASALLLVFSAACYSLPFISILCLNLVVSLERLLSESSHQLAFALQHRSQH